MSTNKLAKVFHADLWGLRERKYEYLFGNDIQTTEWQELKPDAPYYFFVPKDFALQSEYEKFWKVTEIFEGWSSGVKTHRDHFVVGFNSGEVVQRLRIFMGELPDELVVQSLNLKDTSSWKLAEVRKKIRGQSLENEIHRYTYRPFDIRWICYNFSLLDRDRWPFMRHLLMDNIAIALPRNLQKGETWNYIFAISSIPDLHLLSILNSSYIFPLYLYQERPGDLFKEHEMQPKYMPNFTTKFLQAIKTFIVSEAIPEEIFYYIYAVLYSPIYRKRYEEFLKIDFPRVPLPSDYEVFKELSNLGKELVDLHLLKASALDETEVGFPKGGSNGVEKVSYDDGNKRVFINKEQFFEGVSKEVWEYRIGAYQVMEKYLKDRKKRKLSLDEINHYMKVAKAIQLTIELQEKIDDAYRRVEV